MANDENVVTANLPLLFSNGSPASLAFMTAEDCQYFLSFLMKCVLGPNATPKTWTKYPRPKWWLPEIPWSSLVLTSKYRSEKWRTLFQGLIRSCYESFEHTSLLVFSKKLYKALSKGWKFRYENNQDGTTTMYHVQTGKVLAIFKSEIMLYDRGFREGKNPRMALVPRLNIPRLGKNTVNSSRKKNVCRLTELPCDIYLCDSCGEGFGSESADHELKCIVGNAELEVSSSVEPDSEAKENGSCSSKRSRTSISGKVSGNRFPEKLRRIDPEEEPEESAVGQLIFLNGFNLMSRRAAEQLAKKSSVPDKKSPGVLQTLSVIPVSTERGQSLYNSYSLSPENAAACVRKYEAYCLARPASLALPEPVDTGSRAVRFSTRWNVTFRKGQVKRQQEWSHTFSFSRKQRLERLETIEAGLSSKSRLLLAQCTRKLEVRLKRITEAEIQFWTKPRPKTVVKPVLKSKVNSNNRLADNVPANVNSRPIASRAGELAKTCQTRQSKLPEQTRNQNQAENRLTSPQVMRSCLPPCQEQVEPILIDLCSSDEEDDRDATVNVEHESTPNTLRDTGRSDGTNHRSLVLNEFPASLLPREVKFIMQDECKELRHRGLSNLLHADERVTRTRLSLERDESKVKNNLSLKKK